eukprot:symbB.v1.2.023010.t1/scaffold2079.1/size90222/3
MDQPVQRQRSVHFSEEVETRPLEEFHGATKADSNLPTCYYLATTGRTSYEGEHQWIIELEKGWSVWLPGNEPFQGSTDQPMRYTLGRYDFEVHFESETRGTQRNLTTGKIRRIQRVQKGEAFPAWEGTGLRRRPAGPVQKPANEKMGHGGHDAVRRGGYGGGRPPAVQPGAMDKKASETHRPQVSHAAYPGAGLPRYMRPLKSKA